MKKIRLFYVLTFLLFQLAGINAFAQVVVHSSDSLSCTKLCTTLTAVVTGDAPTNSGITLDDTYSGVLPIGFGFNFYGTTYTNLVIGPNGTLCFNTALSGAFDPYVIAGPLLGNPSKFNNICGPWCDIDISVGGGTITYSLTGIAPHRKYIVTFCNDAMYSCTTQRTSTQIILYETTNIIECHVATKPVCAGWNGGRAIIGVQNATGTAATTAPGRDFPSVFTCANEAWRFTPNAGVSAYTVASIAYAPVPYASSAVTWYNASTGAAIGTGTSIVVCPTTVTEYKAGADGCAHTSFGYYTVTPAVFASSGTISGPDPLCAGSVASYSSTVSGGTWSCTSSTGATINSATGVLTTVNAGTIAITYTVPGVCVTPAFFTVNVSPMLTPGVISGPLQMCEGDPSYTYTFSGSGGGTWSSSNSLVAAVNPVTGVVTPGIPGITTISYLATSYPCPSVSDAVVLIVHPKPTFAGFAEITGHHCEGSELTFQFLTVPGAIVRFETTPGSEYDGIADPFWGLFSHTMTAVAPSTSIHIIYIEDPVTHCRSYPDAWLTICVDPEPNALSVYGYKPELCVGETDILTSVILGLGTGTGTWSTDAPGIVDFGLSPGSIMGISPGTATIYYGVSNCCGASSNSWTVTVNPLPAVTDISYYGCMMPCPLMPLTFYITGTPNSTVYWSWQDPATAIWHPGGSVNLGASGIMPIYIPGATGTGTLYVRIDDAISDKGCHGRNYPLGMIKIVWPQATIMDPISICEGADLVLHFTGTPGATAHFNTSPASGPDMDVLLDAMGDGSYTIMHPPAGIYTYCITGATGCCPHPYAGNCVTATVYAYPTVTVNATPNPVCEGDDVVFTTTVSPMATDYVWSLADPWRLIYSTGLPSITLTGVTMLDNGYNGVTVSNHGCATSAGVELTVNPLPAVASVTYVGCNVPCPGTPLYFEITGTPGATVLWEYIDPCCPFTPIAGTPVVLDPITGIGTASILIGAHSEGTLVFQTTDIISADAPYCHGTIMGGVKVRVAYPKADICTTAKPACGNERATLCICGTPFTDVYVTASPALPDPIIVSLDKSGYGCFTVTIGVTTTFQVTSIVSCCTVAVAGTPVTVVRIPYPTVTLTYNDPLCEGSDLVLTATCPDCTDPYYWEGPAAASGLGGLPATTAAPTYTIPGATPALNGMYVVSSAASDRNSRLRCESNSAVDVVVHPLPLVTMTCSGVICPTAYSASATLTFTGGPAYGSASYTSSPSFPGGMGSVGLDGSGDGSVTIPISTSIAPIHFVLSSVVASAMDGGCANYSILAGCTISADSATPPSFCPVFYNSSTNSVDIMGWVPGTVVIVACLNAGGMSVGTATLTAASTPVGSGVLPSGTIYFTVVSYSIGGCMWGLDCAVVLGTPEPRPGGPSESEDGMASVSDAVGILRLIPNPNNGAFTLAGNFTGMTGEKSMNMEIVDMLGRVIFKDAVSVVNGNVKATVKMDDEIANGTYLLKITGNEQNRTLRFVVQK